MNNLEKLRDEYFKVSKTQKEGAWKEKNFKKATKIREKEKINYEKWKLLDGIIKANKKNK